ncbi:type A2 lantipeptide [Streptomyces sp. NPDC001292]|uniref:type A2 lantipeptide n=1 Tax=Streptomyces sp. NPDC001292 TaxID=3364558 RepID=UPI003683BB85
MNPAPQVATAEISDADLDNISGGLAVGGGLYAETPIADVASGHLVIATPEGVAADAAVHTAAH